MIYEIKSTANSRIALCSSTNAVSISSARTTNRFPSRSASAIRSFDFEKFDDMEKQAERKATAARILGMNKALVKLAKPQLRVLLTIAASVAPLNFTKAGTLTAEEQALVNKGAVMEMYEPDEHSRHFIAHIDSVTDPKTKKASKTANNPQAVVCFVFGIEDAEPARKEGQSMAECHYSPSQAHEFLFAQGWDKYHDRFFTRCYVQEGEGAYDKAVETQQKHVDESSSS